MKNKISDRSREFSQEALQRIEEIQSKYKSCPVYEKLTKEENDALLFNIIQLGNAVAATNYKKFSFYSDAVKYARNDTAHSTKNNPAAINEIYKNVFSWLHSAKKELSENIEKSYSQNKDIRREEKFGTAFSTEEKRKSFVDSVQSSYHNGQFHPSFTDSKENALSKAALSVLNPTDSLQQELLNFAKSQTSLEESIKKDIVEWTEKTNKILEKENPFVDETVFNQQIDPVFPKDLQIGIKKYISGYNKIQSVKTYKPNIDLDFYQNSFEENISTEKKKKSEKAIAEENQILSRNLKAEMQKELIRRKTDWELAQIEKQRKILLKELYEKIEKFKKIFERLKSFTKNFGRLWDLAQGELNDNGFDILEKYAELLQDDEELTALAEMIGRHHQEEQEFHKELRAKIVVETVYNPEPAYKGEIAGLRLSDSLLDALPSELALYNNPSTRQIFKMKYAQKQLLSYSYTRNIEYKKTHEELEEVEVGETIEHKGPMIICVDTSGSMQGTPERVAKTVAFALAQKSLEEERGCYLISFSTGIETMDLSSFNSTDGITNLVKFLRMSFNGGTDANPALNHSVKLLEEKEWKNADVLMISDFVMGKLGVELEGKIKVQQEQKCRFFSLAVTSGGNNEVISTFDKNWIYDTSSKDSSKKLIRQIEEMDNV
ncbi:VWA domain-containing protein [Treponema sp. Marseille-Q3903]|uniref:VWA domain-containing protein n=1 Tax=Treponema sp. Marseille-Q3903 TaxID=2766703 RepID=UPI0016522D1C|nr:VWA domain-containing protein [Treponema sp. Marseille-Q3903]MBC6714241.1 VWA domain-containing protein [Treponema sp. Marseille-Q3903]